MQAIGFIPQRNIRPAFGCEKCEQIKKTLTDAGVGPRRAKGFVESNTALIGSEKRQGLTHEQKAEKLSNTVGGNLDYYVKELKKTTVN
ncbi:MAG: hypothetical protein WCG23_00645 [bacterium]